MTSENCRKEAKAEAVMKGDGQYLFPFMTGAMDVVAKEENPFPEREKKTLGCTS